MEVKLSNIQRKSEAQKRQNKREQSALQYPSKTDIEAHPYILPYPSEEEENDENMEDMEENFVSLSFADIPGRIDGLSVNVSRRWMGKWTNEEKYDCVSQRRPNLKLYSDTSRTTVSFFPTVVCFGVQLERKLRMKRLCAQDNILNGVHLWYPLTQAHMYIPCVALHFYVSSIVRFRDCFLCFTGRNFCFWQELVFLAGTPVNRKKQEPAKM